MQTNGADAIAAVNFIFVILHAISHFSPTFHSWYISHQSLKSERQARCIVTY